jgi:hypothetical protein
LPGFLSDLSQFGFGDFTRVDSADAGTFFMHHEHNGRGLGRVFAEYGNKHLNHKIHARVIVIVQKHIVAPWLTGKRVSRKVRLSVRRTVAHFVLCRIRVLMLFSLYGFMYALYRNYKISASIQFLEWPLAQFTLGIVA